MLQLCKINDEGHILHENLTDIDTKPEDVSRHYNRLVEMCEAHRGFGLGANQVGLRDNFFFIAASVKLERGGAGHICIKPTWKPHPKGLLKTIIGEGCLSLPGQLFAVQRWTSILATWTNTQGHVRKDVKLSGLAAQVFQHEHDHLRGLTLLETGQRIKIKEETLVEQHAVAP